MGIGDDACCVGAWVWCRGGTAEVDEIPCYGGFDFVVNDGYT